MSFRTFNFGTSPLLQTLTWTNGSNFNGTLAYSYDADSHIVSKNGGASGLFQSIQPTNVVGAVYDADNRLCAWNTTSGSCATPTITWDNNGNLVNDGANTYSWDSRNRLTAISSGQSYSYDALGRRLSQTSGSTTTSYIYDGYNLVQKQRAGADLEDDLTGFNIDQTFLRDPATAGQQTFVTDALGTVLQIMATGGAVKSAYGYDPYGVTYPSTPTSTNTLQYAGRENDGTGLYYNRARYYNPAWGRFISQDPLRFTAGVNFYQYAMGNPVSFRDPYGEITPLGNFVAAVVMAIQQLINGPTAPQIEEFIRQQTSQQQQQSPGPAQKTPAQDPTPPTAPPLQPTAPAPTNPNSAPSNGGGGTGSGGGSQGGPTPEQTGFLAALLVTATVVYGFIVGAGGGY
ncbi:MAG: RHS repeat-associated core domain-containing protein [Rhodospirillales bacterium]